MQLSSVAQTFDVLEKTSSRLAMTQQLATLFEEASPEEAKIIAYLSLGEMNPPYVATQFQLAEKTMIKILARIMDRSEEEIQYEMNKFGDLGLVVLTRVDAPAATPISVMELYEKLQTIAAISGTGAQEKKFELVGDLLSSIDNVSAKFVARILIGKLRLGFSDMTIIDALSWLLVHDKSLKKIIEHAYNVCADIGEIAYVAKDGGIQALEKMNIHVGIPIRPAAAERLPTAQAIVEKLGVGCVAQPKLDGFRLQIHIDKTKNKTTIKFFSRNLIDMSHMFPDLIKSFEDLKVTTLICEGEAIVFDQLTGHFVPFQETVKRKRKYDIEQTAQEMPLKVFIFDILYLNGETLLDKTHKQRRALLLSIFNNSDSLVLPINEITVHSVQQLEEYFYQNIEAGLEGLVVKRDDSVYQPGKRNFNWIKLKRQEEGHLEDTLDCVVLGYYGGQGKRAQFGIGGFLVGIYNKQRDMFEALTKIGTGLSDEQWVELRTKLDEHKVHEQPKNVECVKELHPDVWVYPMIVILVRADEITKSPRYTAGKVEGELGFALRFPRFMGYREDKSAIDATTAEEIRHLYKNQKMLVGG